MHPVLCASMLEIASGLAEDLFSHLHMSQELDRHLHFHFIYIDFSVLVQKMELTQQLKQILDTTQWI